MLYDVVWRLFHRFSSTPLAIGAISMTLRTPANALITDMYSLSKKGKKGKNHEILPNSCQVFGFVFFWGPSESFNLTTSQWPEIIWDLFKYMGCGSLQPRHGPWSFGRIFIESFGGFSRSQMLPFCRKMIRSLHRDTLRAMIQLSFFRKPQRVLYRCISCNR